jgi:Zinc finger, C3HC4 type (RING finger)
MKQHLDVPTITKLDFAIMKQHLDVPTITKLSYPGWRADKAIAESLYCEYPSSRRLQRKLIGMKNKQRLYEGDRSHPEIVALDAAIFTYPGWQQDRDKAERIHTDDSSESCDLLLSSSLCGAGGETSLFEQKLHVMKKKQRIHSGNRSRIRFLKHLDSFKFTYPGWRDDKVEAENFYCEDASSKRAMAKLTGMKNKQRLFQGDRSHPEILALDSVVFTYSGWQEDKKEAVRIHTVSACLPCETFEEKLRVMKRKQRMHSNRAGIRVLRHVESMTSRRPVIPRQSASPPDPPPAKRKPTKEKKPATAVRILPVSPAKPVVQTEAVHCVVCFEHAPSHAYIPCGHRCVCRGCASRACTTSRQSGSPLQCPVCRGHAICVTKIFL